MFEPVLSIDMGAAYTKIAFRPRVRAGDNHEAALLNFNPPGAIPVLIPSLAIQSGRDGEWIFGMDAARRKPDNPSDKRYANWKPGLFSLERNAESVAADAVCGHFVEWLRKQLSSSNPDYLSCKARVAIPALPGARQGASLIAQVMAMNGWSGVEIIQAPEPRANLLGIFTEGRNVVHQDRRLLYAAMYGGFHNIVIQGVRHNDAVSVLVLDVGAYSSDVALVTYAPHATADLAQDVKVMSWECGIVKGMDEQALDVLYGFYGLNRTEIDHTFEEWEAVKKNLYNGVGADDVVNGVQVELGSARNQELIRSTAYGFADALYDDVSKWLAGHHCHAVYLTGGGVEITPIRDRLTMHFRDSMGSDVIRPLPVGIQDAGFQDADRRPIPPRRAGWRQHVDSISRVATALGGASIVLDPLPADPHRDIPREPPRIRLPSDDDPDLMACDKCAGQNKACCFCGGTGEYKPRYANIRD